MKNLFWILSLMALVGCAGSQQTDRRLMSDTDVEPVEYNPHSFLMTSEKLPDTIDLDMNIDDMTMMELRLLRNYPYALKGMWLMEADLNRFFDQKSDWYYQRCLDHLTPPDWQALLDYDDVKLSAKETAFVKRVDERISELNRQLRVERDGLTLSNPVMAVNMFQIEDYDPKMMGMLSHHNFAVMPTKCQQLFNIYEENDYTMMPNYITTDLYLQAFHMYFSYVMKSLEKDMFIPRLHELNKAMYGKASEIAGTTGHEELRSLAEHNATYFAIAEKLLTGGDLKIPEAYQETAREELENIRREKSTPSPMMVDKNINFPYDMFKPRGHYTRGDRQKRYFRYMMWMQTYTFCREGQSSLQQAALMAYLLNSIDREVADRGLGVYRALDFLMGEPDNVAVVDIADYLAENRSFTLEDVTNTEKLRELDSHLRTLFKTRNRITSKIEEDGCEDKINFMPQRYTPDAYVLSRMSDPKANCELPFPRGLDVFAAFGVDDAEAVIDLYYDDAGKWDGYTEEMNRLKTQFGNYADWDKSMYNKWMECLVELQKPDKRYPDYMKTGSWSKKNLNTALASWSELKHDAVLYAEQPIMAECGAGGDFPEPDVVGYVEPNLRFWNKMREMLAMTRTLLEGNGLMTDDLDSKTKSLEDYMDFCINVSEKELKGEQLTSNEYQEIRLLGSSLEWYTLSVLDPEVDLYSWDLVKGADRSVACVADVFTRNVLGCKKNGILYEATGNADVIYVNVEIGGKVYLTRGATFSYFEFVNPLGDRLTDEQWQERLEKNDIPGRPVWMKPLIMDKGPKANEEVFYSSGC